MKLVFPEPLLGTLRRELLATSAVESCAVAFTHHAGGRLVVSRVESPPVGAYVARTAIAAVLSPDYLFDVANRARAAKMSVVLAHSHPGDRGQPSFSQVDDVGEKRLKAFLDARAPGTHCALVASPGGLRARVLGEVREIAVTEVGRKVVVADQSDDQVVPAARYERQVRAFGAAGQRQLAELTIAVVGVGGTGSIVCQELPYLGVTKYILIDFDFIEETNLNRIVGTTPGDVGKLKTDVAQRSILAVQPGAEVKTVNGNVIEDEVAREVFAADLIFICTDSHASRAVLNQIAYQYLIPAIDMGVGLSVRDGKLAYITGRVQLLAPGLPCLTCMDLLDSETIRREMLTPEARAADQYIQGDHEPQPAVISLNGTMASLAISMFLGVVTDAPIGARNQIYDGVNGTVRNFTGTIDPRCFTCSDAGALTRGDSWALPTRRT